MPTGHPARMPLRGLLRMRPGPSRWPAALRVSISTAVPLLIGWAVGDIAAGLIATLGAFTAAYGNDRPYLNRGAQLAAVAIGLAAAVTVGAWAAAWAWVAVVGVSAIAVLAVWLCAALAVGPPGAYMFVVACAAGVGASASHRPAWQIGLLVLAGGAVAWISQMSTALTAPRGPEKAAVAAAGDAVADYLEGQSMAARRGAAMALSRAWYVLVDYQPRTAARGLLQQLREANHALHVLFTDAMGDVGRGLPVAAGTAAIARGIGNLDITPGVVAHRDSNRPPLRQPSPVTRMARAISPGAQTRRVMQRVAVAAPVAGAVAATLGVGHVYWAVAAAVLVLHQGTHRVATLQRGTERMVGTLIGLGFAAAILSLHPQGLWLVLVVSMLQFAIELFIVRNYAVATVFITAIALTISSATRRVDIWDLVVDRGVDTVIGCGVGLAVYLLAVRGQEANRVTEAVVDMIEHTIVTTECLARGDVASLTSRAARRELQDSIFDLADAEDAARGGSPRDRATAAFLAPVVASAEHLGYATVTACWAAEQPTESVFGSADPDAYLQLLQRISEAVRTPGAPVVTAEPPPFAAHEVGLLTRALAERCQR